MNASPFDGAKVLAHSERIRTLLRGEMPPPVTLELEPSNICNHACLWCNTAELRSRSNDLLPLTTARAVIEDAASMGVRALTITGGGEPLVHPEAPEIIATAIDAGMKVGLQTNGALLGRVVEQIAPQLTYLRGSIDAGDPQTHRRLHATGNHDQFTPAMRYLGEAKKRNPRCLVGAAFLVHPQNAASLPHLLKTAEALGLDYVQVKPLLGASYVPDVVEAVERALASFRGAAAGTSAATGRLQVVGGLQGPPVYPEGRCITSALVATVGATGDVYTCCHRREDALVLGNVHKEPFATIWTGARHRRLFGGLTNAGCPRECRFQAYNTTVRKALDEDRSHVNFL